MSKYRIVKNNDPDLNTWWEKRTYKYIIQYFFEGWNSDGSGKWLNDGYAKSVEDAEKEIKERIARSDARDMLENSPEVVRVY